MSETLPVRVLVHDTWDEVELELPAAASVETLKEKALSLTHVRGEPGAYQVKFRGASVLDESQSLAAVGLVPHAQVIVLARRRRPVR